MPYLIDSNIFIYAGDAASKNDESYQFLVSLRSFYYASISKIEGLGYHKLDTEDKIILESMFISDN